MDIFKSTHEPAASLGPWRRWPGSHVLKVTVLPGRRDSIYLFLTRGGLMNNHGNISFAVRACGLHRCYKPGAGSVALPTSPSESCPFINLPFPRLVPFCIQLEVQSRWIRDMWGVARDFGDRSRKQTSTQACHVSSL